MSKRYMVITKEGRKFMVEEWGDPHITWGNINPATKKLEKVQSKEEEIIDETNTKITKENGFRNICFLSPGTSPLAFIDALMESQSQRLEIAEVKYID